MTTTDRIEYIPPEFYAAIELMPDCFVLRSAIADRLEELGESLAAECIRWTIDKQRSPSTNGRQWANDTQLDMGYYVIPCLLYMRSVSHDIRPLTNYWAFDRLICWWRDSTPQDRIDYWNWECPK